MILSNNIFVLWLTWHFFEASREILKAWRNYLLFNLNYFSIPILLRTFFSPWRRYVWSYGRGFDPSRYFEVALSNTFSRFIGMVLRSFLILIGLVAEIFIILVGLAIFLLWLALPLFIIGGIYYGFRQLLL